MEKELTFDQLPYEVTMLRNEISELKHLLTKKQEQPANEQAKQWLDLNDLIQYDPEKRTKPTWYSKISKGEVPYHKRGKKVYFLKAEIDNWLKSGKQKSNAEIEAEAEAYLSNNKRGLNHAK